MAGEEGKATLPVQAEEEETMRTRPGGAGATAAATAAGGNKKGNTATAGGGNKTGDTAAATAAAGGNEADDMWFPQEAVDFILAWKPERAHCLPGTEESSHIYDDLSECVAKTVDLMKKEYYETGRLELPDEADLLYVEQLLWGSRERRS